ncbi:Replication protein O [Bacillus subtilis]|uniref:Replication protein O n=1 Tax=Bacillus TaxID=1386 RepID=UPI000D0CD183|nr:Replication protein O [Bacillus subtilis]MBJ3768140.1 Replication protein O [Bacillus subtilis]MDI6686120.1 Replication protein O [Bacillus subtilis]MED4459735.1 Replication protein O [Bacillus subtilis]PSL96918.1 Replication protein O [Bacillus subtilis]QOJ81039.1 Replication protein O [Bacillus subtilis]
MIGWIKLHRSVQDHWIYQEKRKFSKYEAWLDLLMMASHKDNKFVLGNELYEVKRGQFISSIRKLGERWSWSNTKVTQFLDLLRKDEMIDFKKDTKKTLITIVNYGVYHDSDEEKKTVIEHENDTKATQKHTIKNEKNVKNEKNINTSRLKYEICDMENAEYLFKEIKNNNPDAKKPNLEKWANEFRLIRERDKRTDEQIKYLIKWTQQDDFWKANILSPSSLRKHYDKLVVKIKSVKGKEQTKKRSQLRREDFNLDD